MTTGLEPLLTTEENILLNLRGRYLWLRTIEKELDRRTAGGTFRIENDLVWMSLIDTRDALYIHFASWAKSLVQEGGLLPAIRGGYLGKLYVPKPKKSKPKTEKEALAQIRGKSRRERFELMFPEAAARSDGKVRCEEFDKLKDAFYLLVKPVIEDRDSHRAHPYERRGDKVDAALLRLDQIEPALEAAQELLNGMRVCALNSTLVYGDHLSWAQAGRTAQDLIDLTMFVSLTHMLQLSGANDALKRGADQWWWEFEREWRERLQAAHAILARTDPELAVNADVVLEAARPPEAHEDGPRPRQARASKASPQGRPKKSVRAAKG